MTRTPKNLPETPIDPEFDGLSEEELERKAAGDIAMLDDAAQFGSYKWSIWRRRTAPEIAAEPDGGEWESVAQRFGPIDEAWARTTLGGGTFEFRGYFDAGTGRRMTRKPIIIIAGPRKDFTRAAPEPTPQPNGVPIPGTAPALSRFERIMVRQNRELNQRLANLETSRSAPTSGTLGEMIQGLVALDTLRGKNAPPPPTSDGEMVKLVMGALGQGIEIGRDREPLPASTGTDWAQVIKEGLPLLGQFLETRARRRAAAAAGMDPANVPPPSGATEVPDPPQGHQLTQDDLRWINAAAALEAAVAEQDDPRDFAASLEGSRMLSASQLGLLRVGTPEAITSQVRAYNPQSLILASDAAAVFIAAVLEELKHPTDAEDSPDA